MKFLSIRAFDVESKCKKYLFLKPMSKFFQNFQTFSCLFVGFYFIWKAWQILNIFTKFDVILRTCMTYKIAATEHMIGYILRILKLMMKCTAIAANFRKFSKQKIHMEHFLHTHSRKSKAKIQNIFFNMEIGIGTVSFGFLEIWIKEILRGRENHL